MSGARRVAAGTALACLGIGLAAGVLHARETRDPLPPVTDRFLFLQSGRTADRVFLSFDALAADVYWIRAIQHYGRDRKSTRTTDRFALLEPLLDLTTTLDPHFNIAYRFGAIFLAMDPPNGPGRPDEAIRLLQKGLRNNPTRWQYAHDIGFVYYWHAGNYQEAAQWFERASTMPGAPEWIKPLAAVTLAQGGDRRGARQLLHELESAGQRYLREAAERGLAQLQALDAVDALQARVDQYQASTGRYPRNWFDLVRAGLIGGVPVDATQTPFEYDPATHLVSLSPKSGLMPLPGGLR